MVNDRIVLLFGKFLFDWSVVVQFDEKQCFVVNEGNFDDDFYIIVMVGEILVFKCVLDWICKLCVKFGDLRLDVL